MSTLSICNAIQALVRTSTLIRTAYNTSQWPDSIDEVNCPVALTRPGPGSWPHECFDAVETRRTYVTEIYVRPNASGLYYQGVVETLAIIDAVGAALTASSSAYTLAGGAMDSEPRDRGLVILTYGGVEYRGTIFETEVVEDVA